MEHAMTFELFKAYPPDRDSAVAQLHTTSGGEVQIPMEVARERGELRVSIFAADGSVLWDFPLDDVLASLRRAAESLG
jgi:hypothetical protein